MMLPAVSSLWVVQILKAGQVHTNDTFCCPNSRCSLLISDLLADPNHTVIEEHRTDSITAEVKLCHVRCAGWTFSVDEESTSLRGLFTMESMWVSPFRSGEMVVPRNRNDSTAFTELFMIVRGGELGGFSWSPRSSNVVSISLPQGHPRCRCLFFFSRSNFDVVRSKPF